MAARATPAPDPGPPYYEATEPLYVGNPEAGVAPARAFSPGDPVPPDLVGPNGWAGKVRVPAVFAGVLPDPAPAAEGGPPPPRPAPAAATTETASDKE